MNQTPTTGADSPTPERFEIKWHDGNYYVSIPSYAGGEVVPAARYDALERELTEARAQVVRLDEQNYRAARMLHAYSIDPSKISNTELAMGRVAGDNLAWLSSENADLRAQLAEARAQKTELVEYKERIEAVAHAHKHDADRLLERVATLTTQLAAAQKELDATATSLSEWMATAQRRAAGMVRDSGAVEALERAGCWVPSNAVDTKKALTHPVHECRTLAQVDAALAKLKAITQP